MFEPFPRFEHQTSHVERAPRQMKSWEDLAHGPPCSPGNGAADMQRRKTADHTSQIFLQVHLCKFCECHACQHSLTWPPLCYLTRNRAHNCSAVMSWNRVFFIIVSIDFKESGEGGGGGLQACGCAIHVHRRGKKERKKKCKKY